MSTQLEKEVTLLRSAVIGLVGNDPEGEYNPAYVRRVLRAAHEKPTRVFVDAEQFLAELKKT